MNIVPLIKNIYVDIILKCINPTNDQNIINDVMLLNSKILFGIRCCIKCFEYNTPFFENEYNHFIENIKDITLYKDKAQIFYDLLTSSNKNPKTFAYITDNFTRIIYNTRETLGKQNSHITYFYDKIIADKLFDYCNAYYNIYKHQTLSRGQYDVLVMH